MYISVCVFVETESKKLRAVSVCFKMTFAALKMMADINSINFPSFALSRDRTVALLNRPKKNHLCSDHCGQRM
jgi:hypothetical protein